MNWLFNNKAITSINEMPKDTIGFIYMITHNKTGKIYIGKKSLYSSKKTKISNREKTKKGTRKRFKIVIKESNWLDYTGSSEELNNDIKKLGINNFSKKILEYCFNKKYLSFSEIEHQIKLDVLRKDTYNANIFSRYFRADMENKPLKKKTNGKK